TQIEIAGFLPAMSADLMIVPSNLTKQKGLDFDIDKENAYQYHHYLNKDGKFEPLNESHKTDYLTKYDKLAKGSDEATNLMTNVANSLSPDYNDEDFSDDEKLKK